MEDLFQSIKMSLRNVLNNLEDQVIFEEYVILFQKVNHRAYDFIRLYLTYQHENNLVELKNFESEKYFENFVKQVILLMSKKFDRKQLTQNLQNHFYYTVPTDTVKIVEFAEQFNLAAIIKVDELIYAYHSQVLALMYAGLA